MSGKCKPEHILKIGAKYDSKHYGKVEIIDVGAKPRSYKVKFLKTGTIKEFRADQILAGTIRDPYALSVYGIGCTGNIKTTGKKHVYYRIWHDMMGRCYNKKNRQYKTYYSVTVSMDWLMFENFYNDRKLIDGFDDEKIQAGEYVLDKDIKQRYDKRKVYSVETCTWVPKHVNEDIQDAQQKPFIAISPDDEIFHDYNITRFAREHDLSRIGIQRCLHGEKSSYHGWKFSYEEIV